MSPTEKDYEKAFRAEQAQAYPEVDDYCKDFPLEKEKLEGAARVLACPVKKNSPNWQHGRVIYATVRDYASRTRRSARPAQFLDIGTAKGFSALCALWAAKDSQFPVKITSVDVIDPEGIEKRNTVAEVKGPVTLHQILKPWPEAREIEFKKMTSLAWFEKNPNVRVCFAFVDGKHAYDVVKKESEELALRQQPGDVIVFDDVQIEGVCQAVRELGRYRVREIRVKDLRSYAIAERV